MALTIVQHVCLGTVRSARSEVRFTSWRKRRDRQDSHVAYAEGVVESSETVPRDVVSGEEESVSLSDRHPRPRPGPRPRGVHAHAHAHSRNHRISEQPRSRPLHHVHRLILARLPPLLGLLLLPEPLKVLDRPDPLLLPILHHPRGVDDPPRRVEEDGVARSAGERPLADAQRSGPAEIGPVGQTVHVHVDRHDDGWFGRELGAPVGTVSAGQVEVLDIGPAPVLNGSDWGGLNRYQRDRTRTTSP